MSSNTYQLIIDSNIEELPKAEEFIISVAEKSGLPANMINNIILAVNEATVNAMVHGNKLDIQKKVIMSIMTEDNLFQISIKDEGKGFLPETVPDPTNPENLFKESGRGLHIMKSCMGEMKYNFTCSGTELILKVNF